MKSKWFDFKEQAIYFRKQGYSIRTIENRLGIARSTLSGWFKDIKLTAKQKSAILENWKKALGKAREKAILWHHAQKQQRIQKAKSSALETLEKIDVSNTDILELALAILYFGEGFKKSEITALGNSDPLILKFFLYILINVYHFDTKKIKCELHLRADQKPEKIKRFWASELKLPLDNFKNISIDKRTEGSKTYPEYKGVCILRCGNVAIQRKLLYLSNLFCNKVINTGARSSVG